MRKTNRKQERLAKYFHSTLEVYEATDVESVDGTWERLSPGTYRVKSLDNEDRKYVIRTFGEEIVVEETEIDMLVSGPEASIHDGDPVGPDEDFQYESVEEKSGDIYEIVEDTQINADTMLEVGDKIRILTEAGEKFYYQAYNDFYFMETGDKVFVYEGKGKAKNRGKNALKKAVPKPKKVDKDNVPEKAMKAFQAVMESTESQTETMEEAQDEPVEEGAKQIDVAKETVQKFINNEKPMPVKDLKKLLRML